MSSEEAKLLLPVLDTLSDYLRNEVCADWGLPNTPTGQALWRKINEWSDPDDKGEWTLTDMSGDDLFMPDIVALDYLIHCLREGIAISN